MGRPKGSKNKVRNLTYAHVHVSGRSVYEHRLAHGMTQSDFGKKLGISNNTIQKIEKDLSFTTSGKMARKIAQELINNPIKEKDKLVLDLINKWNDAKALPNPDKKQIRKNLIFTKNVD